MTFQEFQNYFNLHRADSGWLRLFIVGLFIFLSFVSFKYAYFLILKGVSGEFKIAMENFRGITLYITSVSPGLVFIIAAVFILCWALPRTLKSLH